LKKPEEVTITVYNQLGKVVRRLVNQRQSEGFHQIFWDAKNEAGKPVSGGIYFYTTKAGNQLATKSMMVIK
jgi:flagellar hook assembly protein FlgD